MYRPGVSDGKIAYQVVERAERIADFTGVAGAVDGLKRAGIADEGDGAPKRPSGIDPIIPAVIGRKDQWDFPSPALGDGSAPQPFPNVLGNHAHVPHYQFRPAEYPRIDALEDKILVLPRSPDTRNVSFMLPFPYSRTPAISCRGLNRIAT